MTQNIERKLREVPIGDQVLQYAGIHLAGVNSQRTAIVILSGHPLRKSLKLKGLYEKIGHIGNLFSDDRLLELLRIQGPLERIFVDCPLSAPPCVTCPRATCPGIDACEDIEVAYMLSIAQNISSKQKRRRRSLNPQVQRLWDVYRLAREENSFFEPTYSTNNSNQTIRAMALQKRLSHAEKTQGFLEETNVTLSLRRLAAVLDFSKSELDAYRSFSQGAKLRSAVIERLENKSWVERADGKDRERLVQSVDVFEAFICSFVAALAASGLCEDSPEDYVSAERWVYRPELQVDINLSH